MNKIELRKDWLTSNAVVAFTGALLMGQSWKMSEGTVKLLFIFTVPDYTALVILIVIAGLFVLSMFSALAAVVPISHLQHWAIDSISQVSPVLGFLTWVAFFVGLASVAPDLPPDQWWSWFLIVGGFVLWLFLLYRSITTLKSVGAASRAACEKTETDSESPPHP